MPVDSGPTSEVSKNWPATAEHEPGSVGTRIPYITLNGLQFDRLAGQDVGHVVV